MQLGIKYLSLMMLACVIQCFSADPCSRSYDVYRPDHKLPPVAGAVVSVCGICFVPVTAEEVVVLFPCHDTHRFHPNCIYPWLSKKTCPLCKQDAPSQSDFTDKLEETRNNLALAEEENESIYARFDHQRKISQDLHDQLALLQKRLSTEQLAAKRKKKQLLEKCIGLEKKLTRYQRICNKKNAQLNQVRAAHNKLKATVLKALNDSGKVIGIN